MDENEVQQLVDAMKAGGTAVELDVHPYTIGNNLAAMDLQEASRQAFMKAGNRVAYVYTDEWTSKNAGYHIWMRASAVTREQALRLLSAGAKWVGPDHHRPA